MILNVLLTKIVGSEPFYLKGIVVEVLDLGIHTIFDTEDFDEARKAVRPWIEQFAEDLVQWSCPFIQSWLTFYECRVNPPGTFNHCMTMTLDVPSIDIKFPSLQHGCSAFYDVDTETMIDDEEMYN